MKKHTLGENIISFLIGGVLVIPICILAYKDQKIESAPREETVIEVVDLGEPEAETSEVVVLEVIPEEETVIENTRVSLGMFRVTAYCPCAKCCGEWADGITATGTVATEGYTIAVDPDVIPLGSIVEINGVEYVAEDVGGAIKGNRADIYFNSHEDALKWGVQEHEIFFN